MRPPAAALTAAEVAAARRAARWRTLRTRAAAVPSGPAARGAHAAAAAPATGLDDPELRFFAASEEVAEAYRPGPLDRRVSYFLAEGSRRAPGATLAPWRRAVPDLQVIEVPGHHGDLDDDRVGMLSARHVAVLAAAVSQTLP